jgi:hypothetical protein
MKHLLILIFNVLLAAMSLTSCKKEDPAASSDAKTYSVALRVRRVTYEDAYVAVPATDAIMKKKEDGTYGIDFEKFVAEAIRISKDPKVEWKIEESKTEPHEIQQAPPEGRKSFDSFYQESGQTSKD